MNDLIVRGRPIPDPPVDVVAVRAPGSPIRVPPGTVLIEHLSTTGHDDRITRPAGEAVPLFWRFMIEKFGVEPADGQPRTSPTGESGDDGASPTG